MNFDFIIQLFLQYVFILCRHTGGGHASQNGGEIKGQTKEANRKNQNKANTADFRKQIKDLKKERDFVNDQNEKLKLALDEKDQEIFSKA